NAVTQINEKLGRIDILVNCAGVYPRVGIHDITEKDWRFVFDINVMGSYFMMVECAKAMKATGEGRIVNVSSIDAFTAHPSNAHYAATKAAVVSLTRSFALEVAKNGILVNSVAPGPMATERALKSDWFAQMTAELPTGVAIEPEEIARTVVYLCDPKNKSLTGENIIVSGGGVIA
ncbi:MAG: 3-oxoacyl-[acyl-carrier protein] reductase, partial [Planctomycetota bacterium]